MATGTLQTKCTLGGRTIEGTITRTEEGVIMQDPTLAAGKTGTLTTRTSDVAGVVTMTAGHGLVTDDVVDVYWDGGVRYGCTATVSTNALTLASGAGDVLPAQSTAVVVTKEQTIDLDAVGNNVVMASVRAGARSLVHFQQANGTSIVALELQAGESWAWASDTAVTNPFSGVTIGQVKASCGISTGTSAVEIGILYGSLS